MTFTQRQKLFFDPSHGLLKKTVSVFIERLVDGEGMGFSSGGRG
ncbi:MAG: hypothetical protein ACK5O1_07755 [Holosporales bacterium]|jgi:hypothetical protein